MQNKVTEVKVNEELTEDELIAFKLLFPKAKVTVLSETTNRNLQKEYCKKKNVPIFAPTYCFSCGSKVYDVIDSTKAANEHITSCPKCRVSFVD